MLRAKLHQHKAKPFLFLKKSQILGVVKRNPLFLHEIEWKNNRFLFTTPNITERIIFEL